MWSRSHFLRCPGALVVWELVMISSPSFVFWLRVFGARGNGGSAGAGVRLLICGVFCQEGMLKRRP
jgi:hypothetical protein